MAFDGIAPEPPPSPPPRPIKSITDVDTVAAYQARAHEIERRAVEAAAQDNDKDKKSIDWALKMFSRYIKPDKVPQAELEARALAEDVANATGYLRRQYERHAVDLERRQVLGWHMNRVRAESALNVALETHFGDLGSDLHTLASIRTGRARDRYTQVAHRQAEYRRVKEEGQAVDPAKMSHLERISYHLDNLQQEYADRDAKELEALRAAQRLEQQRMLALAQAQAGGRRRKHHHSPFHGAARGVEDIDDGSPRGGSRRTSGRRASLARTDRTESRRGSVMTRRESSILPAVARTMGALSPAARSPSQASDWKGTRRASIMPVPPPVPPPA